jgi:phosphohistidine phosphatase
MTELYLLRHADAGNPDRWAGEDAERPLSAKGQRQAARLAAHLRALAWAPDSIVTSPKRRASDTAGVVADSLGVPVRVDGRLAEGFGLPELKELLAAESHAGRVLLVGHDPDFSDLASVLVGAAVQLRKGSLIRIDLDDAAETGVIRWLLPPDVLPEA